MQNFKNASLVREGRLSVLLEGGRTGKGGHHALWLYCTGASPGRPCDVN